MTKLKAFNLIAHQAGVVPRSSQPNRKSMRVYICHWQTRKSPTSTFYTSTKRVEAEDEEDAEIHCKRLLADSFRDCGGAAHIIVTKTEHIRESS